jgi:DNA-directed RNA polymerase
MNYSEFSVSIVVYFPVLTYCFSEEEQPAFHNTYRYEHGFKIGIIKVNDVIVEKLSKEPPRSTLHPRHLPMVARPRPWIKHNAGGYLYSNCK